MLSERTLKAMVELNWALIKDTHVGHEDYARSRIAIERMIERMGGNRERFIELNVEAEKAEM